MVRLSLTAVAVCLLISVAESQDFTILIENSQINVTVGGNALFSVKPSAAVKSGSWAFGVKSVGLWLGTGFVISNEYESRAEIFPANGSLLLKSVTDSDSGEYTVTMVPDIGSQTTASITLRVLDQANNGNDINNINSGGIAGIVIAVLLIVGFISVLSVYLVTRKTGGMKGPTQGQNDMNINSTVNDVSATIGDNSTGTYENIPRKQKDRTTKPLDDNSPYMGLQLEDRSVYSNLRR